MKYKIILFSILSLVFFSRFAFSEGEEDFYIDGSVYNKSIKEAVSNIKVTLIMLNKANVDKSFEQITDSSGNFRFGPIKIAKDDSFYVKARYKGITYGGELLIWNKISMSWDNSIINIYEPGVDPVEVSVDWHSINMSLEHDKYWGNVFIVREDILVNKRGDSIYVGDNFSYSDEEKTEIFRITLPFDAFTISFIEGFDKVFSEVKNNIISHKVPLKPGWQWFKLSYKLPYRPPYYMFNREAFFNTRIFRFKFKNIGAKLLSDELMFEEIVKVSMHEKGHKEKTSAYYMVMSGETFERGKSVRVNISELPNKNNKLLVIIVFFDVLLIFLLLARLKTLAKHNVTMLRE